MVVEMGSIVIIETCRCSGQLVRLLLSLPTADGL